MASDGDEETGVNKVRTRYCPMSCGRSSRRDEEVVLP